MNTESLFEVAGRLWDRTYLLDELLGNTRPSEYVADQVRAMWRDGRANDVAKVAELADTIEGRVRELTGEEPTEPIKAVG